MHHLPEKPDWLNRVTIVGCGLLGGSVGLSLRRSGIRVQGYARKQATCESAMLAEAVDEASVDLKTACEGADAVVIASPVDRVAELAGQVGPMVGDDCLITDVGSTKGLIVREVAAIGTAVADRFVAAHPIAGSEKTGVENATATLLDGKVVILTPDDQTLDARLARAREFWLQTGGRLVEMTPDDHDERLAEVSHVPHLIASLLASLLSENSGPLIGSGWTDMTRVASGDPEMWSAICEHNRGAILSQLDRLERQLRELRGLVSQDDAMPLRQWLVDAKRKKDETTS
ncbi:MAG: prephenate dehydrogenase/arogenate dehydrogenase family protein [Planctomycetota bacterium]